jgi:acetyl-CoA carboxylase biotin carboxylase subunit
LKKISRVLIANRGEIAVRIIRACQALGIESVAAVSEVDQESLPAKMADRAVCIGPARALDSYLNIGTLITAALGTGSDAIHPGYGFLAEQPELVEACEKHHIKFIGPSANSIRKMGNKILARQIVEECGVPTIPGSEKICDVNEAVDTVEKIGFPVLLKAAAGGGGRGMKILSNPEDLKSTFDTLSAEVEAAFGDGTLYFEKYIPNARHIEVQILGDHSGNLIHLGERDCSIQRRHQKLIEEAPSPVVTDKLRDKIGNAAVAIADRIGYESAGTIEFMLDQNSGQFYFLEMNTRIQVEHPVTEQISGVDLVQEQIKVAEHQPLNISQKDVQLNGHAIECRINAESVGSGFLPSPGLLKNWNPPNDSGIRVDTHCFSGYLTPPFYDSLLAKVISTGADRTQAIDRMKWALENFVIFGVDTTIPLHSLVLNHPDFINGKINTRWLEDMILPSVRSDV